jgi:GxxExxY protein
MFSMSGFSSGEPFANEGYRLVGAAMEVYNEMGGGLAEPIYQECMEIELGLREIPFDPQRELKTFYKGRELKRRFIPDLFVYDRMIAELKSQKSIEPEHESQLFNYLRLTRSPVGYLLNFGSKSGLEWKRYLLSEYL